MSIKTRIYSIVVVAGLLLTMVVSYTVLASKQELTTQDTQAATITTTPPITATVTTTPTPTVEPTLLRARNQDVPLKVLGSSDNQKELSYLYTELTSKGIISNVTSTSASILWITEAPQQTNLKFGTAANRLTRTATSATPTYIHEAKLDQLSANTLYYYTGHAPITDSFTTPASLPATQTAEKTIAGTIKGANGMCIVRATLSDDTTNSAYMTVVTSNATWMFSLGKLRTADYSGYYQVENSDTVEVDVLCVSSGKILSTGTKKFTLFSLLGTSGEVKVYREN